MIAFAWPARGGRRRGDRRDRRLRSGVRGPGRDVVSAVDRGRGRLRRPTIDRRRLGGPGSRWDAAQERRDGALRTMLEPLGRRRRQAPEAQAPGDRPRRVRRPRRRRCPLWARQPRAEDPPGDQQHAPQPRAPEPRDHRSAQAEACHCTHDTPISHVAPPMAASAGAVVRSATGTGSRQHVESKIPFGRAGDNRLSPAPHRPWACVTQRDHARGTASGHPTVGHSAASTGPTPRALHRPAAGPPRTTGGTTPAAAPREHLRRRARHRGGDRPLASDSTRR